jgi:hypothetical protein
MPLWCPLSGMDFGLIVKVVANWTLGQFEYLVDYLTPSSATEWRHRISHGREPNGTHFGRRSRHLTFIPKGFEKLAGGKRNATTGSLVRIDVSRRDTRIRHSCIPPGCVGVAARFPVVALRLPPANI